MLITTCCHPFTCNDQFSVTPTFRRRQWNAGNSDQTFPFPPRTSSPARPGPPSAYSYGGSKVTTRRASARRESLWTRLEPYHIHTSIELSVELYRSNVHVDGNTSAHNTVSSHSHMNFIDCIYEPECTKVQNPRRHVCTNPSKRTRYWNALIMCMRDFQNGPGLTYTTVAKKGFSLLKCTICVAR